MQIRSVPLIATLLALLSTSVLAQTNCPASGTATIYPVTKKGPQRDNYHGTVIADPYRWLEDDNSAETKAWVEAQNKVTFAHLDQIGGRAAIKARLTKLWNYERYNVPFNEGGRYFYSRNDGLQNQAVLYTLKSLKDTPRVLLDPNTLAADGTVALVSTVISPDGKYMAYGTAASGSDWNELRVRDIDTGKDLEDHVKWVKFSTYAWTKDGKGFFYSRFDAPAAGASLAGSNYFKKLYYHKLGTPQSADPLILQYPDQKEWRMTAQVSEDGRYLVIYTTRDTSPKGMVSYMDLSQPNSKVVTLFDNFEAAYTFIENDGRTFYFRTNQDAPRGRVVAVDLDKPQTANWKSIVPESTHTLVRAGMLNGQLVVSYLVDAHSAVKVFARNGKLVREIKLPGIGSADGFGGKKHSTETFYSFGSYTTPSIIYRLDMKTGVSSVFRQPKVGFDPAQYETRQQFFTSRDGTRVPMFIVSKKGLKLDGSNPTYLYGYGGFNISPTPGFSPGTVAWLEMGGVYVVANIRGGGEYGKAWHEAGIKQKKQNVFDDFIGAAEWLIANKITSPAKLAIGGGSNGGLLVGAVMNQRPELSYHVLVSWICCASINSRLATPGPQTTDRPTMLTNSMHW